MAKSASRWQLQRLAYSCVANPTWGATATMRSSILLRVPREMTPSAIAPSSSISCGLPSPPAPEWPGENGDVEYPRGRVPVVGCVPRFLGGVLAEADFRSCAHNVDVMVAIVRTSKSCSPALSGRLTPLIEGSVWVTQFFSGQAPGSR